MGGPSARACGQEGSHGATCRPCRVYVRGRAIRMWPEGIRARRAHVARGHPCGAESDRAANYGSLLAEAPELGRSACGRWASVRGVHTCPEGIRVAPRAIENTEHCVTDACFCGTHPTPFLPCATRGGTTPAGGMWTPIWEPDLSDSSDVDLRTRTR